ncbi:PRD domain-containing protein [Brevibacillus migulae]|uniref:PRD domain-containing protein n=1 Tax=Brevibacillus migulae TaxID=1644114 RepID=UPI00106E1FBA|nr:PRD domain-containing protein [Brevibacillus migulae]
MNEKKPYKIKKIISNNALLALDHSGYEVILLGKGIGFQRTKNDTIPHSDAIEKVFIPSSANNREAMLQLFSETGDELMTAINSYLEIVEKAFDQELSQQFVFSFIDHIAFAIKRIRQGIRIYNPFLHEVKNLYPLEYALAEKLLPLIKDKLDIELPEDELGFITLHLRTIKSNQSIAEMTQFSQLITTLVELIEEELSITINKTSTDYARLVTHIRFAIDRAQKQQGLGENHPLSALLQREYPVCYNLSYKLVKIMQNELKLDISEAEVSYLTLHIQRLAKVVN